MTDQADPALIGRTVANKFVVERYLGGGSMGSVYLARQQALDKLVAIKILHPSLAHEANLVARFHREAKAASRLDHPNSMRVIDFGEESDGLLYIAMEYLEGRDLYRVIQEDWPLSDERIVDIIGQALAALAVAHEMGVIHRDLKPENIMVLRTKDDEGKDADLVKVCDFGIAKIMETDDTGKGVSIGDKLTSFGVVVGTPEYMSPEQARGEKLDTRSDLYSVGAMLYQLLTGRVPFTGDGAIAVVIKQASEMPAPPETIFPDVHRGLAAVCMRALAKNREERFQTARELRAALRAAIDPALAPTVEAPARVPVAPPAAPVVAPLAAAPAATAVLPHAVSSVTPAPRRSRAPIIVAFAVGAVIAAVVLFRNQIQAAFDPTPASTTPSGTSPAPTSSPPGTEPKPAESAVEQPAAPASASASPFDAASCKAELGQVRAVAPAKPKELHLGALNDAWTKCLRTTLKERPAQPLKTVVDVRFDNRAVKSATCPTCSPALARCLTAGATRTLLLKPNEAPQDPTFAIPVTFSCE